MVGTKIDDLLHVRIGDYWLSLAEDLFQETGLRAMRRQWPSVFAERSNTPGRPGFENVITDDLRWFSDDFGGGEGQRVIDHGEEASFTRYERGSGIDLSNPSELRLAREMAQSGLTGGAVTTVQGSVFTTDAGSSVAVGNDLRLESKNSRVKRDVSLAAGTYQLDIHGYIEDPARQIGSALTKLTGPAHVETLPADCFRLDGDGATVAWNNRDPADETVKISATGILGDVTGSEGGSPATVGAAEIRLVVRNHDTDANVAIVTKTFSTLTTGTPWSIDLSFEAKAGKTYDYVVKLIDKTHLSHVDVQWVYEDVQDTKTIEWAVKDGAVVIASGTVDVTGTLDTARLATTSFVVPAPDTWTVTYEWTAGSRKVYLDKITYQTVGLDDPRLLGLGLDDLTWLVDYNAAALPSVLWRDPTTGEWEAAGTIGSSGKKAIAMTFDDHYQYVALDDKIVYRATKVSTAQYTAAFPDKIIGLAVAGNRLIVVTSSTANGDQVYSLELEGTPNVVIPAASYIVGDKGVTFNDDYPQRVVGTKAGAVFYSNQGPRSWLYQWDGAAGAPLGQLPVGFRARALQHGHGLTWIGGSLPAPDTDGTTRHRPLVAFMDGDGTSSFLESKLYRDGDPSTRIMAMQLYATDLWVLTGLAATEDAPEKIRLWRISLRSNAAQFGAFLEVELDITENNAGGEPRGLSINHVDRLVAWSKGAPFHQGELYVTSGRSSIITSRYGYGIAELKHLARLAVTGEFPPGTSVEVWYRFDNETEFSGPLATFTEAGEQVAETPEATLAFRTVQLEIVLRTTDPNVTPVLFDLDAKAFSQIYDKQWELLIDCRNQSAVRHRSGQQFPGSVIASYLMGLAERGTVEFEDAYSSQDTREAAVHAVTVESPDLQYITRGEAVLRVRLRERSG